MSFAELVWKSIFRMKQSSLHLEESWWRNRRIATQIFRRLFEGEDFVKLLMDGEQKN